MTNFSLENEPTHSDSAQRGPASGQAVAANPTNAAQHPVSTGARSARGQRRDVESPQSSKSSKRRSVRRRRNARRKSPKAKTKANEAKKNLHEKAATESQIKRPGSGFNRTVSPSPQTEFSTLAQRYTDSATYLQHALEKILQENRLVGYGFHGCVFGKRVIEFGFTEGLDKRGKEEMKKKIHQCMTDCKTEQETVVTTIDLGKLNNQLCVISMPMSNFSAQISNDDFGGIVSFAFIATNGTDVPMRHAQLRCDLLLAISHLPFERPAPVVEEKQDQNQQIIAAGNLGKIGSAREFAFKLVHEFVGQFKCQQVALGIETNNSVEVFAVSGMDSFKANSPGIVDIQQAMDESRDSNCVVVHQTENRQSEFHSMPLHEHWSQKSRSAVCSIPLRAGEDCVAVLSLSKCPSQGFEDEEIQQIEKAVESFGPALDMAIRSDRSLIRHCAESLFSKLKPDAKSGILVRLTIIAALLYFIFGKMPYRPATVCELLPAEVSQTTAPFDVKLLECNVRSGDLVSKGDLLAKLDSKQLELERESLVSRIEQLRTDVRKALGEDDVSAAYLAKANATALEHELKTVTTKIELCSIYAPADGVVLEANLEQKIGQVFPQGERILTFSPMKNWELEMEVPESLARYIEKGQTGNFCLNAWPDQSFPYQITSVSAGAELVDGRNIFVAKAMVDQRTEFFRQGMAGIARTDANWQPVCWVMFRDAYEYLHQNFWF